MDLKTKFVFRALIGFSIGLLFGAIMLLAFATDEFMTDRPLVFAHLICSGIMGLIGNGGAIVYELESWGVVRATFTHFVLTFMAMLVISEVLGWFSHSVLFIVFIVFSLVYLIIWLVEYMIGKKQVNELNKDLHSMMQKSE